MKKIKQFLLVIAVIVGVLAVPMAGTVSADVDLGTVQDSSKKAQCQQVGGELGGDGKCRKGGNEVDSGVTGIFRTVTNILLFLVGSVAVIMIVVGGFRYVTSNGDQNAITGAKSTVLYAVIGIVVAFLAYAAVSFIIDQLGKAS